jgi:hypothetical protein
MMRGQAVPEPHTICGRADEGDAGSQPSKNQRDLGKVLQMVFLDRSLYLAPLEQGTSLP